LEASFISSKACVMGIPEKLIFRLFAAPGLLSEKLKYLHKLSNEITPPENLRAWGERVLNNKAESWTRAAWWGLAAGELLRLYLMSPQHREEAVGLVKKNEWEKYRKNWENKGVVLAAGHVGPPRFAMVAAAQKFNNISIWTDPVNDKNLTEPRDGLEYLNPAKEDKGAIFLRAALRLRENGLVLGAVDGKRSDRPVFIKDFNRVWAFSPGIPMLVRKLGVEAYLTLAVWEGMTIRLVAVPINPPDPDLPEKEWIDAWIVSYWGLLRKVIMQSPINMRWQLFEDPALIRSDMGI